MTTLTIAEMTKIAEMQQMTKTGKLELPDEQNPAYLFNGIATDLLCLIATGQLDAKELAKQQLRNRGLNLEGKWIGFKEAAKLV